ncbi:hypothetical protein [Aporhodopirellula aestuarii]|uniref:Uncharacterized protein n=1 Tax=Aporhodopirellula aestuarii TaxID=2950107 RepID=A0ABT0TYZ3_9BACT|nr:hypothetical protein [Aporhodopirellula aestuarii]MCM2369817.1 hypothetical protein [Aporhodopirellula aestuarii]
MNTSSPVRNVPIRNAFQPSATAEPDAHVRSRHLQVVIRVLLIVSTAATVLLIFIAREYAYVPAILIPFLLVGRSIASSMESSSRANELRRQRQNGVGQHEIDVDVETVWIVTLAKVFGALALGALIIATVFFDAAIIGLATVALLLLGLLIELPILIASVEEAECDEREMLTGKREQ